MSGLDDDRRRELESYAFEARYWMAILDDLRDSHGLVGEIAGLGSDAALAQVDAMLALALGALLPEAARAGSVEAGKQAVEKSTEALRLLVQKLGTLQERLVSLAELAEGRVVAIRQEAGLPDPEADPEEEL